MNTRKHPVESPWQQLAQKMFLRDGYAKAHRETSETLQRNSPGTITYAFNVAILKHLDALLKGSQETK